MSLVPGKIAMSMIIKGNTFVSLMNLIFYSIKNENLSHGSFHDCFCKAKNALGYINVPVYTYTCFTQLEKTFPKIYCRNPNYDFNI